MKKYLTSIPGAGAEIIGLVLYPGQLFAKVVVTEGGNTDNKIIGPSLIKIIIELAGLL